MKTLKIKNRYIIVVSNLLNEINLKNQASRGRNKLIDRLVEKSKEFQEDLTEIRKEYFQVGEDGNLKAEDGRLVFKEDITEEDIEALNKSVEELQEESFEIAFVEHSKKYEALFDALNHLDEELSGEKALAYDVLLDAYEENGEEK